MMRFTILVLLSIHAFFLSAQQNQPVASLQWSKDSTVVGGQAELILSLDGISTEPGEWYWDTTLVVPMDTTIKGRALDTLWEMASEPKWYSNNPDQWQCRMPVQFWNAGLFFYGGLHIMNADNSEVIHNEEELQTAMYVYYPTSIRQSQEIKPLRDIIPARHAHAESWIRLLWPGLIWTLFCLFVPLLLGRQKFWINKKDKIVLSAYRWWEEIQGKIPVLVSESNKEKYAELSRQLRYWIEEKLNIPAKEWTTAQLERYTEKNDGFQERQIKFLHLVDDVVYGFGERSMEQLEQDQKEVNRWTEEYAQSLDTLARPREEVEPILPDLVYEQSLEGRPRASIMTRAVSTGIDLLIFLIPLLLVSIFSGVLPYYTVLKDSYGIGLLVMSLVLIFAALYMIVESFWLWYRAQTPGDLFTGMRSSSYLDLPWTYFRFLKRSVLKILTSPLVLTKMQEDHPVLVQDKKTHIYRES